MIRRVGTVENIKYQEEDADVIDYELFDCLGLKLRGPKWDPSEPADLNFVGSARVFGRLIETPFTQILTEKHGIVSRNIGFSGCTPAAILANAELLEYLKRSVATPIIQVCAADGGACDWFKPDTPRRVVLTADGAVAPNARSLKRLLQPRTNRRLYAEMHGMKLRALREKLENDKPLSYELPKGIRGKAGEILLTMQTTRGVNEIFDQVRKVQDWHLQAYHELSASLSRPSILLYFNSKPFSPLNLETGAAVFRVYPQLVDRSLYHQIAKLFADKIAVVSEVGTPWRRPGRPDEKIFYYPSPKMHKICAKRIAKWHRRKQLKAT